jgi:hypothetical protein
MADRFDPYLHWLGIRDPERPPNHYEGAADSTAEPSDVLLVTPISAPAPRPKTFAPAPRTSSSVALLLTLLGVIVLLVLGLIHVWRNVDALREKGIDGWGAPADSSGGQDVRDAGRQPRSKPKPQAKAAAP